METEVGVGVCEDVILLALKREEEVMIQEIQEKAEKTDSSLESPEGIWPCKHLDLGTPTSRTVR